MIDRLARRIFNVLMRRSLATYRTLPTAGKREARLYLWGHAFDLRRDLGEDGARAWLVRWSVNPPTARDPKTGRFRCS